VDGRDIGLLKHCQFIFFFPTTHYWFLDKSRPRAIQLSLILLHLLTSVLILPFSPLYSKQGDLKWVKLAGGPEGACGSLTTDHLNNIFITGQYTETGVFGNDILIQPGDRGDCFLAKYDLNGNLTWATNTKSSSMAWGWAIASSSDGSIYIASSR
jgi:hypothetical protein